MNRTIKFRGKRLDNGEWVYGDLEYNRAKNIARIHTYDEDGEYLIQHSVDPATVGQFTGLLDKNGKEIYEGDILMLGSSDAGICEVKWNESQLAFCIRFYYERNLGTRPLGAWARDGKDIAILGNIHDNPELLNEK
ncbi:YopX family protein [Paramuribaculum intestinale]|uniref:YopX family protein n=1 Tax=Paramuribaculum intestinale TaxID=2094151 RepID=UPI0025B2DF5F|nr:YopX family protein [Paramuribaculum intestinale]